MSPMANNRRGTYIERDSRGRERLVVRRSSSGDRGNSTRELLAEAEDRIQALEIEIGRLQTRLSFEQRETWNLRREHERLAAEHHNSRHLTGNLDTQVGKLEELLDAEEKRSERLEDKLRLMKRGLTRTGEESHTYKQRYEEKVSEVEVLRIRLEERDELIRLHNGRIVEKDRSLQEKNRSLQEKNTTIAYLKEYLRTHGFRVEG
ncbi:uncharacterized protein BP5553_00955 [Venustampulla echinocandica]|uniref:Uncharacterized protein n=1 Tax=Venustampulla echinocandica TaxID=2656787 RepID=A0A370TZM1_9HELO|nr:uncharacterized protein BP5553_00955 [Venustampulla echinocandica]RDL40976.1 hypothetical protein BP5553_00955 [Venustampulla echinocandica]